MRRTGGTGLVKNEKEVLRFMRHNPGKYTIKELLDRVWSEMNEATMYRIMYRFIEAGLAFDRWRMPEPNTKDRPVKEFELTLRGVDLCDELGLDGEEPDHNPYEGS